MNEIKDIARADRCPGISYTDMLNGDTRRPPDYLFEETTIEMGDEPLSVAPYISEEFARLEREKMWPNVWLFAARETWSLPVLSRGLLYVVQHSKDVLQNKQPRLLCYDLRE